MPNLNLFPSALEKSLPSPIDTIFQRGTTKLNSDAVLRSRRGSVLATRRVVATGQPLVAQAALEMLRPGGNAADAAIATTSRLNGSGHAPVAAFIKELRPVTLRDSETERLVRSSDLCKGKCAVEW